MSVTTKELKEVKLDDLLANKPELVLYNDDFNTFDFVIDALISVCGHATEQAHQCTLLVHYKGQCGVKTGSKEQLKPLCKKLLDLGLTAKIVQ